VARPSWRRFWYLALILVCLVTSGTIAAWRTVGNKAPRPQQVATKPATCPHTVRVVTASSFAPVLRQVARELTGAACVNAQVTVADGQSAPATLASRDADLWIPDDAVWNYLADKSMFAPGGGAAVATSPFYFVTSRATATPPRTWAELAGDLSRQSSTRLVVRDPLMSGDGMVPGGALTYEVDETEGLFVAAYNLMLARQEGTTVMSGAALPRKAGDVGIVPEYALLQSGTAANYTVIAPRDDTALMRFTWYPTKSGIADPDRASALGRLRAALVGDRGLAALHAAGLRGATWPAAAPPSAASDHLPATSAEPMAVTMNHAMWHVLATWSPARRAANVLVVVDVSGSMGTPPSDSTTPLIALVRQGIKQFDALLPGTARMGLWQFGSQLAPPRDYQQLAPVGPMDARQRTKLTTAISRLNARRTGTGLYDTILAAYKYQQAHYSGNLPNEIIVFTDGINEDDPVTISLAQLKASLGTADPHKRVQIALFGFGNRLPVHALSDALSPVAGQVDALTKSNEVVAAFVHAVSGGMSGTMSGGMSGTMTR
jgi:hypothetical protein